MRSRDCASAEGDQILTLDQAAGILPRPDMLEYDIALKRAKERNARTNEHGHTGNDQALDEPGLKKALDRNATVDVRMLNAPGIESRDDGDGIARFPLDDSPDRGRGQRAGAEDEYGLRAVRPRVERQHGLVRVPPDDERIHGGDEFLVAVGFTAAGG